MYNWHSIILLLLLKWTNVGRGQSYSLRCSSWGSSRLDGTSTGYGPSFRPSPCEYTYLKDGSLTRKGLHDYSKCWTDVKRTKLSVRVAPEISKRASPFHSSAVNLAVHYHRHILLPDALQNWVESLLLLTLVTFLFSISCSCYKLPKVFSCQFFCYTI